MKGSVARTALDESPPLIEKSKLEKSVVPCMKAITHTSVKYEIK